MESQNCYCCGKILSEGEEKKRRRLLSNPKLQAILQTLTSLIAEFGCVEEVDVGKLCTGYICRVCFGLVEKYQKLHQQLNTSLSRAFPFLPKKPGTVDRPSEVLAAREHQVGSTDQSVIVPSTCPVVVSSPVTRSPALTVRYLLIFVAVIFIFNLLYRQGYITAPGQKNLMLHLPVGGFASP